MDTEVSMSFCLVLCSFTELQCGHCGYMMAGLVESSLTQCEDEDETQVGEQFHLQEGK